MAVFCCGIPPKIWYWWWDSLNGVQVRSIWWPIHVGKKSISYSLNNSRLIQAFHQLMEEPGGSVYSDSQLTSFFGHITLLKLNLPAATPDYSIALCPFPPTQAIHSHLSSNPEAPIIQERRKSGLIFHCSGVQSLCCPIFINFQHGCLVPIF